MDAPSLLPLLPEHDLTPRGRRPFCLVNGRPVKLDRYGPTEVYVKAGDVVTASRDARFILVLPARRLTWDLREADEPLGRDG